MPAQVGTVCVKFSTRNKDTTVTAVPCWHHQYLPCAQHTITPRMAACLGSLAHLALEGGNVQDRPLGWVPAVFSAWGSGCSLKPQAGLWGDSWENVLSSAALPQAEIAHITEYQVGKEKPPFLILSMETVFSKQAIPPGTRGSDWIIPGMVYLIPPRWFWPQVACRTQKDEGKQTNQQLSCISQSRDLERLAMELEVFCFIFC